VLKNNTYKDKDKEISTVRQTEEIKEKINPRFCRLADDSKMGMCL
jgi:hypothetical protein